MTNRGDAMTAQELTDAEAERVARFEAAPEPEEITVERVARAMWFDQYPFDHWDSTQQGQRDHYRRLAVAAVTAYRTQHGGAEESHPCSGRFCRECADAAQQADR